MRTYADPVEVRTGTGETADAPTTFVWRGRLYVVRDVLGHWRERRSWWSSSAARRVHGEGNESGPAGGGGGGAEAGGGAGGGGGCASPSWRRSGRCGGSARPGAAPTPKASSTSAVNPWSGTGPPSR